MKFTFSVIYTIATALVSSVSADSCSYIDGNYYCNSVSAVYYEGIGYSGSYSDVTNMDEESCECTSESHSFSGTLSPLDEELSIHFRGPIKLAQFGVYYPSSSSSAKKKREAVAEAEDCTTTRHVHHRHKRAPAIAYEYVTETVYADANGNVVTSSVTNIANTAPTSTTDSSDSISSPETTLATVTRSSASESESEVESEAESSTSTSESSSSSSSASASTTSSSSSGSSTGDWTRSAYFTPGSADGLVFLNSMGGTAGSGTWSSCFGNSLSYCASNGVDGAASATALDDVTIDSNVEFMIFSDTSCDDDSDSDCGYYRSDIPAYHGFSGAEKIFVFEFLMPEATDDSSTNNDMPAIWMLNAKIPRTLQYGDSSCSCWSTGCGEFDLFEILSSGSDKLICHLHDGQGNDGTSTGGGGTSNYFDRPYDSTMKAAVIFYDGEASIVVLDDDTSFDSSLSSSTISSWLSTSGTSVSI